MKENLTKEQKIAGFNPNDPAGKKTIFGLPDFTREESKLVIIPACWAPTLSYRTGTEYAPAQILNSSRQIDLYFDLYPKAWQEGIMMLPIKENEIMKTQSLREEIQYLREKKGSVAGYQEMLSRINDDCHFKMNQPLFETSEHLLHQKKIPAVVGGDHSAPFGAMQALSKISLEQNKKFSLLHIDAHMDLRRRYEGLEFSHASAIYNYLQFDALERIVQVGIRDFCQEEDRLALSTEERIKRFTNKNMRRDFYRSGRKWDDVTEEIIDSLNTQDVYVTIDMDGFDPKLCPNTGTPVPGGLEYEEFIYLIERMVVAGRRIIGFDICETGVAEKKVDATCYDTDVAARLLWQMSCYALWSEYEK